MTLLGELIVGVFSVAAFRIYIAERDALTSNARMQQALQASYVALHWLNQP